MQDSAEAVRISTASHAQNIQMNVQSGQIVLDDTRLRNWQLASTTNNPDARPIVAKLTDDGNILRIRTMADNTLDIRYTTPSDSMVWSANTISEAARKSTGVDLWVDGADIRAFWIDGLDIKTATSSDYGHTWSSSDTIYTLGSDNSSPTRPQLCAPAANTLIFTDSSVGADDNGDPKTALYVIFLFSGTWGTPILWTMGGQNLGTRPRVTLPDGNLYPSNLSGIQLGDTQLEISWYGADPREQFEHGIWVQRIANIDYSTDVPQYLQWSNPDIIMGTVPVDDANNSTVIFASFPRLQRVGDEIWIIALECSLYAGVQKYHLAFFRSSDGYYFSDRDYHQGATTNPVEQVGAYVYDGGTPFVYTDLMYANLIVTPARTFIVGYDKVFFCPSTSTVGVDNPAMQLDLTSNVVNQSLSLPTSPSGVQGSYTIWNPRGMYNNSNLLTAHRGIRILHKAGYVTSGGNDLVTIAQEYVDELKQDTELGKNQFSMTTIDATSFLQRQKMDLFWEFFGSQQIAYTQFCDLSMLGVIQGHYTTTRGNRLLSGVVRTTDNFRDDIGVLLADPSQGGQFEIMFKCDQTWTDNHVGIAFQGKQGSSDTFWSVIYNRRGSNRFLLSTGLPRTTGNSNKLYHYVAVQASDVIILDPDTRYWLRVAEWQGRVMAWYTTDNHGIPDTTWIQVINYDSPASPALEVLPCRVEWWGIIGTQRVTPSGAIGNLSSKSGSGNLHSGFTPTYVALRVHTGTYQSTLRKVNIVVTQENPNGTPMPNINIMLVTGTASSPDDISDEDNVIFAQNASALHFSSHNRPGWVFANTNPNPALPRLLGDTDYWIVVVPEADLSAGQSMKFWQDSTGDYGTDTTQTSTDGATWTGLGSVNMTGSIEVDYDAGRLRFVRAFYTSADTILTQESLVKSIAAKCGILECDTDDFLNLSDLTLGSDNILWQPTSKGIVKDFVMDITVSNPGAAVKVVIASDQINDGPTHGYKITLRPDEQKIRIFGPGGVTLVNGIETLNYIPPTLSFNYRVAMQQGFILLYINETFLGSFWVGTIDENNTLVSPSGYIGLMETESTTWSAMRIPDLYHSAQYCVLNAGSTSQEALSELLTKPTAGSAQEARYYVRYNGHLRVGTFPDKTSTDTYTSSNLKPTKTQSAQYVISEVDPQGSYYARNTDGQALDTDGRVYDVLDYTVARSDIDAYADANYIFQSALEKANQYTLETPANFAAEREDVITVINPVDGTSGDYIINDIHWQIPEIDSENPMPIQTLGLREAVN